MSRDRRHVAAALLGAGLLGDSPKNATVEVDQRFPRECIAAVYEIDQAPPLPK